MLIKSLYWCILTGLTIYAIKKYFQSIELSEYNVALVLI